VRPAFLFSAGRQDLSKVANEGTAERSALQAAAIRATRSVLMVRARSWACVLRLESGLLKGLPHTSAFRHTMAPARPLEHDPEKWIPVFGEIMLHQF
jgi:hypothetical protein